MLKDIDNDNHHSTQSGFETSTEVVYNEFHKTNPWGITTTDPVFESDTNIIDGTYILYGMGGILIFFIVYTICYSYCMHLKESMERRETELARLNERLSRVAFNYPPSGEGRVCIGNINGINPDTHERTNVKKGFGVNCATVHPRAVESNSIFEPRPSVSLQNDRRYFPEDFQDLICPNSNPTEVYGSSSSVFQNNGNETEVNDIGWMSEPPLCFSSPQESKENILSEGDSISHTNANDAQTETYGNDKLLEKDINITPSKNDGNRSPLPLKRSQSSPTSPEIVRRRFPSSEGSSRRPSSWQ